MEARRIEREPDLAAGLGRGPRVDPGAEHVPGVSSASSSSSSPSSSVAAMITSVGDRRRVDAEQHVHLGAELLGHVGAHRDRRAVRRARTSRVLEVGGTDAEDHRRPSVARERAVRRAGSSNPPNFNVPPSIVRLDEVHRRRADERRDEQVRGVRVEVLRRVDLLQHAVAQHRDAVAERHRLDLVVRDVDGRRPEPVVQPRELARASARAASRRGSTAARPSGTPAARAPSRGPSRRAGAGRPRAPRACASAASSRPRIVATSSTRRCALRLRRLAQLQPEAEVLLDGHVRVERVVLEHHRDVAILRLRGR